MYFVTGENPSRDLAKNIEKGLERRQKRDNDYRLIIFRSLCR